MLSDLPWLPAPRADFREAVRSLRDEAGAQGEGYFDRLVRLGAARLDENQLGQLAKIVRRLISDAAAPAQFSTLRLGLVGDGTLSLLAPVVTGSGVRHGLAVDVIEGAYGSAVQQAMDPTSPLHAAGLDMLLVSSDVRSLGLSRAAESQSDADARIEAAFNGLKMVVEGFRPSVAAAVLVQTVVPPLDALFGSLDRVERTSAYAMVEALNARLRDWAATGAIVLVDIARLAETVGLERWEAPGHWHASKLPFAPDMAPAYGDVVARTLAALRGRSRKCLVLDLDNTLWGGVIGDDGVAGIQLGQGSGTGEAFLAIQDTALELRRRGVLLAVCSKNEEAAALLPFREHPDMLLKESHIAVFQANWTDKAANLRAIAATLNIGIDALVFLDDNPAEREQVRRELPLVAVPELPDDPALYPRMLMAAGYFESVAFTDDDRVRAEQYQANAARAAAVQASGDLDSYLASLDMVCTIREVDATSRPRVAQLINKSNQFNLTTRRYTEGQVEAAESDPRKHAVQIRLVDKFGDNGIICVLIADKHEGRRWEIDTWLMSCRVLGRRVQEAALDHLARAALAEGARSLVGRYVPSPKNAMVKDHYAGLGFAKVSEDPSGETTWELDLSSYESPDLPMIIDDPAVTPVAARRTSS
ncbi:MAG: HAD-IIIC family phosphatase [Phenylobacterium sp.]|uniref:HAD-IIIC family phosphatase n=1 Tax=Phenylobacterium sp. TaxID=1871053 RepID=UPI0025F57D23|nr:HAD-IIIC family phosphatase [Phenylobacterium sp.]MBI1198454.1 HAD-IIIC family phosphatase [Phenylobacterium sp.]